MEHHDHQFHELSNVEANRVHWDSAVAFAERLIAMPQMVELYEKISAAILSCTNFDPETTVLMDFACGNGGFSKPLASHCKRIVGVDISQGMVDAYNTRMRSLGVTNAEALCLELREGEPLLVGRKFDVILCAQSYKHIDDNIAITRVLMSFLKPNGILLVVETIRGKTAARLMFDMNPGAHHPHGVSRPKNMMSHMDGYAEEDVRAIFEEAGLIDITFETVFEKEQGGQIFGLFLAKGVCPA